MKFMNSLIERRCGMRRNLEIHMQKLVKNCEPFLWASFLPNGALGYQTPSVLNLTPSNG